MPQLVVSRGFMHYCVQAIHAICLARFELDKAAGGDMYIRFAKCYLQVGGTKPKQQSQQKPPKVKHSVHNILQSFLDVITKTLSRSYKESALWNKLCSRTLSTHHVVLTSET